MKKLIVTNEELRLIEAGLQLRNAHNIGVLNGKYPRAIELFGDPCKDIARKEKETIDNLIKKVKSKYMEQDDDKTERASLTMTLKLDTTEFENNLKRLGEKLLDISEV